MFCLDVFCLNHLPFMFAINSTITVFISIDFLEIFLIYLFIFVALATLVGTANASCTIFIAWLPNNWTKKNPAVRVVESHRHNEMRNQKYHTAALPFIMEYKTLWYITRIINTTFVLPFYLVSINILWSSRYKYL